MNAMRILSGIQPTGRFNWGNYFGAIRQYIALQNGKDSAFYFIANLHALTTVRDRKQLKQNTFDAAVDLLALGLDPNRATLFVQSDVPEISELCWILMTTTPMGLLERCHAYKDAQAKGIPANHGLFSYPVLMAADILLFQSNRVPVGKDQKQHVEVTRDIALKFNATYGEAFTLPEPEISEEIATIPGIDGQKMSKSYGNTIEIFGEEKATRKKIMSIVTDPTPVEAPKNPDNSIIYSIYKLFADETKAAEMANRFRTGGYGYGDAKKELFDTLWAYFEPYRQKRKELVSNLDYVNQMRKLGADKARRVADETIKKVRELVGVI
jgi:tryptophanyl-tRNA synthetase